MNLTYGETLTIQMALEQLAQRTYQHILDQKAMFMDIEPPKTEQESVMFEVEWIDFTTVFHGMKKKEQNPIVKNGIAEIAGLHHQLKHIEELIEKIKTQRPKP